MVNIFLHYFHFYASKFCTFLKHSIRSTVLFIFLIHKNASVQKLPYTFWSNTSQKCLFFKIRIIYRNIFLCTSNVLFFLNATRIFRCSWERASNKILDLSWKPVGFFLKSVKIYGATYPLLFRFRQTVKLSHQKENSATKCTFVHKRNIKVARMVTYLTFGIYQVLKMIKKMTYQEKKLPLSCSFRQKFLKGRWKFPIPHDFGFFIGIY